jgi:hypothetical protein
VKWIAKVDMAEAPSYTHETIEPFTGFDEEE